jgi:uncharacterized protein YjbI with pentapeptide repeats
VWFEWHCERLVYVLHHWAFLDLLESAGRFAVLVAIVSYVASAGDRLKETHYQAWQVINTAEGKGGNGGRIDALQELHRDGVSLAGVNLAQAVLPGLDLSCTEKLFGRKCCANLVNANLSGAKLPDANLRGAALYQANLSGAFPIHANLSGVDLTLANLRGAALLGTNLTGANLWGANLCDATLWAANLRGANLRGADLRGADLSISAVRGPFGLGADLSDVNLVRANLTGVDLRRANLTGVDLSGACWDETTIFSNPPGIEPSGDACEYWRRTDAAAVSESPSLGP